MPPSELVDCALLPPKTFTEPADRTADQRPHALDDGVTLRDDLVDGQQASLGTPLGRSLGCLGLAQQDLGQKAEAKKSLKAALKLNPQLEEAQDALSRLENE